MFPTRRATLLFHLALAGCGESGGDPCEPEDTDGVIGGVYPFIVSVSDDAFTPPILKAQNDADVTVTLTNEGTVPRGFLVECLATPNDEGCPDEACFSDEATIAPIEPGQSASASFTAPRVEGIYVVRSLEGEAPTAQFIVQ